MAPNNRRPGGAPGTARRASGASASRPPSRRRDAASASRPGTGATSRPRGDEGVRRGSAPFARRSTRRLAMLGGVLVLLAVMLVPTVRAYLRQQQEYSSLVERVAQQERSVSDLDRRLARWEEPAFIEQQARERLKFVKPGEKAYSVIGADKLLGDPLEGRGTVVTPGQGDDGMTWYGRMWSSVVIADRTDADPRTAPVSPVGPRTDPPTGTQSPSAPGRTGSVTPWGDGPNGGTTSNTGAP